jgi:Tetratricopeptide repeat
MAVAAVYRSAFVTEAHLVGTLANGNKAVATLALEERSSMRQAQPLSTTTGNPPVTLVDLVPVVAGWADHHLRQLHHLRRSPFANSAESFAFLRGGVSFAVDDPLLARRFFDESIRCDPKNVGARLNLASLYVNDGQFDAAVAILEEALTVVASS